jgi:cobalt/nickel transport system permease protein
VHIPDGFLDAKTIVATTALSAAGLALAVRQAKPQLHARRVPLMGLASAFVFAAQMLNFPVAGGTSGHLMGAVLVGVLLGPGSAIIVLTSVLVVQCLFFADGGLLALGANVLNMAIVATVGGYVVFRTVHRLFKGERGFLMAVAFASWCSTVLASVCCAGELAWSGTVAWNVGFTAMANVHMLIGLGEAVITALVISAISKTRPDLLSHDDPAKPSPPLNSWIVYGLVVSFALILFVSPFASPWPDGLEKVAAGLGFEQKAVTQPMFQSPMSEYQWPGIGSPALATVLAGAIGGVIVFVLSYLLARVLAPRAKSLS